MPPKENEIKVVYRGSINLTLDRKLVYLFDELKYTKMMENYDFLDKKKTMVFRKKT